MGSWQSRELFSDKAEIQRRSAEALDRIAAEHRRISFKLVAKISKATGIPRRTLVRHFNGHGESLKGVKLDTLLQTLIALEVDIAEFFTEAMRPEPEPDPPEPVARKTKPNEPQPGFGPGFGEIHPGAMLYQARGGRVPDDRHLRDFHDRTANVVPLELSEEFATFLDDVAREIVDKRDEDRDTALREIKLAIDATLPDNRRFTNPERFASYLCRLGVLASIHEAYGRYKLSAQILECAFFMLGRPQWDSAIGGDLMRRAGCVLFNLQRTDEAQAMLMSARWRSHRHGHLEDATLALSLHATLDAHRGAPLLSYATLNGCLDLPSRPSTRFSMGTLYSLLAIEQGKFDQARAALNQLLDDNPPNAYRATIIWRLAVCEDRRNPDRNTADLHKLFLAALDEARQFLEPADLFLIFFDYSEALARLGETARLHDLAQSLTSDLARLEPDTLPWQIALAFIERARSATVAHVKEARRKFNAVRPP